MQKHYRVVLALLCISFYGTAQNWSWGIKATGNHQMGGDMEITTANDGSSYVAGYFQKNLTLGDFNLSTTDDYYSDIFIASISKDGKVRWAKKVEAGRTYNDHIGLAMDDDRNIYLTGAIDGCIFVARYDSTGREIWRNDFNRKYSGYGRSIATDQFDNVYLVGGSGWNFFAAKLDYYGRECWIRNIGVNYSAGFNINDLEVDATGNLYFAGKFEYNSFSLDDIVINQKASAIWGKISPEGRFLWARTTVGSVNAARIALSGNTLYVSAAFLQ